MYLNDWFANIYILHLILIVILILLYKYASIIDKYSNVDYQYSRLFAYSLDNVSWSVGLCYIPYDCLLIKCSLILAVYPH